MINLKDFTPQAKIFLNRCWYNRVGRPWFWYERNTDTDAELHQHLRDPRIEFLALLVDGVPAGFVELDGRPQGGVNLSYLGLFREYMGVGHGKWLLDWVIDYVYQTNANYLLTVTTTTLDSMTALPNYLRAGFRLDRQREVIYIDPRVIWPNQSKMFLPTTYPWPKTEQYTKLYEKIVAERTP